MILSPQKMVEQLRIKEEKRGFVGQPLKVNKYRGYYNLQNI